jgi:hypothetical protein
VTRLQAATRRSAFGVLGQQAAAGPVGESRVRLQRVIPMVGNSFKPFFLGRFEARDDGVDKHRNQCGVPGLHSDGPQQLRGQADGRTGRT